MRAVLPLTRAFARVRRSFDSPRHSSNDAIRTIRDSAGDGVAASRPRRRAGGKAGRAAWPPEARGIGRGRVAVRGEGVMRFWLKPGEMAVTLGPGEEQREERIPAPLRRFF